MADADYLELGRISVDESGKDGTIRIVVETVRVEGGGALLLTGPSSCGKGEIAKELCRFLSIPRSMHIDYTKDRAGAAEIRPHRRAPAGF